MNQPCVPGQGACIGQARDSANTATLLVLLWRASAVLLAPCDLHSFTQAWTVFTNQPCVPVQAHALGKHLTVPSIAYSLALLRLPQLYMAIYFVRGVETFSELNISLRRLNAFLSLPEPPAPARLPAPAGTTAEQPVCTPQRISQTILHVANMHTSCLGNTVMAEMLSWLRYLDAFLIASGAAGSCATGRACRPWLLNNWLIPQTQKPCWHSEVANVRRRSHAALASKLLIVMTIVGERSTAFTLFLEQNRRLA